MALSPSFINLKLVLKIDFHQIFLMCLFTQLSHLVSPFFTFTYLTADNFIQRPNVVKTKLYWENLNVAKI